MFTTRSVQWWARGKRSVCTPEKEGKKETWKHCCWYRLPSPPPQIPSLFCHWQPHSLATLSDDQDAHAHLHCFPLNSSCASARSFIQPMTPIYFRSAPLSFSGQWQTEQVRDPDSGPGSVTMASCERQTVRRGGRILMAAFESRLVGLKVFLKLDL